MSKQTTKISQEQAVQYASDYAAAENTLAQLVVKQNADIAKVKEKHIAGITEMESKLNENKTLIEQYATENGDLFTEKRSMRLGILTIGYRATPAKVIFANDDEKTAVVVMADDKVLGEFIEQKFVYSLDRKKLMAQATDAKVSKALAKYDVTVEAGENFYIKTA